MKYTGSPPRQVVVVVVDDNHDAADVLSSLLESLGFAAHTAYEGWHAVAMITTLEPDVVISDLEMPEMSGIEEAKAVRSLPLRKQPRMVAVTGASADLEHQALAAGFDAFLTKPASVPQLLQAMAV